MIPRTRLVWPLGVLLILAWLSSPAYAVSIVGSKHDLAWAAQQSGDHGLGGLENYNQVCVYCHTPHGANSMANTPLWNKDFNTGAASYTVYSSPTLDAGPANPPGTLSLLCLNCHDGATGVSAVRNAPNSGWVNTVGFVGHSTMTPGNSFGECGVCHAEPSLYGIPPLEDHSASYLTTDLSNDHPIGIGFPDPGQDDGFILPPDAANGWADVPLVAGMIECTTCHDVHDPQHVPFLNIANDGSALCTRCHIK